MAQKSYPFYVITRGKTYCYISVVHRAGCSFLKRAVHAKPRSENPLDSDKFNNYQPCLRCKSKSRRKVMTQPIDTERPHDTCTCGHDWIEHHVALTGKRSCARLACYCTEYEPESAVHQVAKDDGVPWCEPCRSYHSYPQTVEHWQALGCKADRRDFAPAEVHQTPHPMRHANKLGCAAHGFKFREDCYACQTVPPDQHVAPPRIWHSGSLQIAMQSGSWFDRKDLELPQRESHVADIISDFAESVVNARLTPIQAALEACEVVAEMDATVMLVKSDWDALVAAVER